jgi:hypothetical protein
MAREVLCGKAAPEIEYLFHQQIREADILCTTKADLYPDVLALPFPIDFHLSAKSCVNVDRWLAEVLAGTRVAGARLLDVDYQQYADAEAALGWLNIQASICTDEPVSPAGLIGPLLEKLDAALTAENIAIAHLKLFDQTRYGYVAATIRTNGQQPEAHGDLTAESTLNHRLAINLRALGKAEILQVMVRKELSEIAGSVDIEHCRAFQPPPPKPEHRFT